MLILINGIPYFAERMETDFSEYDSKNRYVFCNTYTSLIGRLKFFLLVPFAGGIISANGVSDRSRALDWALLWKKKMIFYWQGTDVSLATERHQVGTINRRYINFAHHIVVAPWFVKELGEIDIKAEYVPYANVKHIGNDSGYDTFRVLTYLAKGAEDFYGWPPIRELAEARPDIPITVVGSEGDGMEKFSNVTFMGWVDADKMLHLFKSHAVYVRLTAHDGKSFAVAQALSAGCEVIWTYEYYQCYHLSRNGSQLIQKIDELEMAVRNRGLKPNQENIAHSKKSYERSIVLSNLVDKINELLK